jgi:hypothetical protein
VIRLCRTLRARENGRKNNHSPQAHYLLIGGTSVKLQSISAFRIGTIAFAYCAVLAGQVGSFTKIPLPRTQRPPSCLNCVRDVNGQISQNPAPVRKFRSTHPCPANGSLSGPCPGYLVDFKKALDHGGADAPSNMRWRKIADVAKKNAR